MTVGVPGRFDEPGRYQGAQVPLTPIIRVPRAPLVTDREYPLNQFWENIDKNATLPDAYGDLWYLAYFQSSGTFPADAIWIKLASGVNPPAGGVISLSDTANTKTFSDVTGNIQLESASAGLTIVSDPPNNKLVFTLPGGGPFIDQIQVQATTAPGVNPVTPDGSGQVTVNGNLVAAHSVPIETRTRGVNQYNIEPQIASAVGSSTLSANGMSHYNNTQFSVDANGYVSLLGGGQAIDEIQVQAATAPGVNPVTPDVNGRVTVNASLVAAHSVPIETRTRGLNAYNIEPQIASAQAASTLSASGMSHFDSARFTVDANGFVSSSGTGLIQTLTPDEDFDGSAATPIAPQAGTIIVSGSTLASAVVTETYNSTGAATGNLEIEHRAWTTPFVVDASTTPGARGTFSTIQAAINAAVSGQTIFIRAGTYTENLTLKAGVSLTSFNTASFDPGVTIVGNHTYTGAGSCSISGIILQTNNAGNAITVSGSSASVLNLFNCRIEATDDGGITYSSSSSSSRVYLYNCRGRCQTTGDRFFTHSSAGLMLLMDCEIGGTSTTASTQSAGSLTIIGSNFSQAITTSSTAAFSMYQSVVEMGTLNTTFATIGGSGSNQIIQSFIATGTAAAISISSSATLMCLVISSTNSTAVITGAGSVTYSDISFSNTGNIINTTTKTGGLLPGSRNTAPTTGYLGEQVRATVASGSAVAMTLSTATNITSISLTAGVWDVSGVLVVQGTPTTPSLFAGSVNTVSATNGTVGDNAVISTAYPTASSGSTVTIPSWRLTISATTTVYLVGQFNAVGGSMSGYGRISATRVA